MAIDITVLRAVKQEIVHEKYNFFYKALHVNEPDMISTARK